MLLILSKFKLNFYNISDSMGGFSKGDIDDLLNDSPFENDFNSQPTVSITRQTVNTTKSNEQHEKKTHVFQREKRIRGL